MMKINMSHRPQRTSNVFAFRRKSLMTRVSQSALAVTNIVDFACNVRALLRNLNTQALDVAWRLLRYRVSPLVTDFPTDDSTRPHLWAYISSPCDSENNECQSG